MLTPLTPLTPLTQPSKHMFLGLQSAPGDRGIVQSPSPSPSLPPKRHHCDKEKKNHLPLVPVLFTSRCPYPSVPYGHAIIFPANNRVTSLPDSPSPTVQVKKRFRAIE